MQKIGKKSKMVNSPPFSFITFDSEDNPLPYYSIDDIAFQVRSNEPVIAVRMLSMDGMTLEETDDIIFEIPAINESTFFILPQFTLTPDCFKMALIGNNGVIAESNTFVKVKNKRYTSQLKYRCDENQFDFIYCPRFLINSVRLPFYLKNPQFPQNQTVYIEKNGRRRVTSATIGKEYTLETDYINENLHRKMVIALSHDIVYIDGKLLTKSGDYNIDWNNYNTVYGEREAKATCMMTENIVARNSNCGLICATSDFEVFPLHLHFEAGDQIPEQEKIFEVWPLDLIFENSG